MRIYFDYAFYNMGTITISKSIGSYVETNDHQKNIKVFPNPAQNELSVTGYQTINNYCIQTISGQIVKKGDFSNSSTIDISFLPRGNYLISLVGESFFVTKKIIKL